MRDLNYTPSSIARQMRLGDSLSIGMLYGDPSSGYQASLNHSFLRACSDAGRYLAVELFDEKSRNWTKQVDAFLERTKITNMVLVPPLCDGSPCTTARTGRKIRAYFAVDGCWLSHIYTN
ncbi:hypothetical protein OA101_03435 [Alphaproteobacteria bacterium]|nr:hypothetical protein [Alphaproteobacteria bacterium]